MSNATNGDVIGGFPVIDPNCQGCGKPLSVENAWMTDGCPCNTQLGVNSMNETRWRLLMELQQRQSHELTFTALRQANRARLPQFKNRKGEPAHSTADGSDWSLGEWCNALCGELGEAANIIKKIRRGDMALDGEGRQALADELADIQTYLDILAFRAGIDLGAATVSKFNHVSRRVGSPVSL